MKITTLTLMIVLMLLTVTAHADRRNYVWTYQYVTMPEGATELEFYQTTKIREQLDSWEYRVEVEHGITDYWDFSVYQIFAQTENGALSWDAVQLRTRYRFGEEGLYPVDPLLYLEYNRKTDSRQPNKLEAKVILAKTIAEFNLAVNPVYELFFAPGTEHEVGLDVGASVQVIPAFVAGIESTSRAEFEDGETEIASYLGPTVSFASGHWWYTLGAAVGLTDESDEARIRFLMGVGL